jgi:hypothetical protein
VGQQNESTRTKFLVNMPAWLTISPNQRYWVEKANLNA